MPRSAMIFLLSLSMLSQEVMADFAMHLKRLENSGRNSAYGAKFSAKDRACNILRTYDDGTEGWSSVPEGACRQLEEFLKNHAAALKAEMVNAKGDEPTFISPTAGLLTVGNHDRYYVEWMTAPLCDAEFKKCQTPKLGAASELGLLLRDVATKELGR